MFLQEDLIKKKYIHFSRFELNAENRGGGCNRTDQIAEVLSNIDFDFLTAREDVFNIKPPKFLKRFSQFEKWHNNIICKSQKTYITLKLLYFLKISLEVMITGKYVFWYNDYRPAIYRYSQVSHQWAKLIKKSTNLRFALVDDPIYFAPLVKKLKKYNVPIIALSQNLESLVPGQRKEKLQKILINKELNILSACNLVVTNSREETFLLDNLNIKTVFLPYYPSARRVNRMLGIRKNRQHSKKKKGIILIGTAVNKPTQEGMIKIINLWEKNNLARKYDKLLVAGFGTESLKSIVQGDGIEFLGTLTNEKHDEVLSSVKACLCYQEKGCGALTRIPDMLIAMVPVVANSHAARSYYNLKGVIEFSSFEKLEQAFQKIEIVEDHIPILDPPDTSLLLSEISKFL